MIRAICNQCGRANIGDGYAKAQEGIDHKDSCPKVSKPTTVKVETPKVVKTKKTPKKDPPTED